MCIFWPAVAPARPSKKQDTCYGAFCAYFVFFKVKIRKHCNKHAPKKGKRGDYMDREREREISKEKRGEIFFNFTSEIQFTFFNRIF